MIAACRLGTHLGFISFVVNHPRPSPVRRVAIPLGGAGLPSGGASEVACSNLNPASINALARRPPLTGAEEELPSSSEVASPPNQSLTLWNPG